MLDQPTWKLVIRVAQTLDEQQGEFRMLDLVKGVQKFDPSRQRISIQPVVQGMTVNAAKGPPSPCGKPLFRVEHGIYRLTAGTSEIEFKPKSRAEKQASTARTSPRVFKAQIVEKRVVGLIEEFEACVEFYDEQAPFTRRGQYTMHRKTIDRRRTFSHVEAALSDEEFLDDLYETLHAWGIGRRASKLIPRKELGNRLLSLGPLISKFEKFKLEDESLDLSEVAEMIWELVQQLKVVENVSLVVPSAKILHHLLPDLVPPMDRAWTGSFFLWSATAPQNEQKETFVQTFLSLGRIARATKPSQYVGQGWRTCPTKIVDNAVIGYCQLHGLASKISDLKVIESRLATSKPLNSFQSVLRSEQISADSMSIANQTQTNKNENELQDSLDRGHLDFQENQQDVSFDFLFGPYVKNARSIKIVDPYIRNFHQAKNLMEFIEVVRTNNSDSSRVKVELLTIKDPEIDRATKQLSNLVEVQKAATAAGVFFEFDFDKTETIHDREIIVDSSWKIILGRGLDIYQFIADGPFSLAHKDQSLRKVRSFGVTYIRGSFGGPDSEN